MPPVLVVHLMTVCAYAGFQWTVRVVVYPQFSRVPASDFPAYEAAHQRRLSFVVGPLFAALVVTTALLLVLRPPTVPWWAAAGSAALLVIVLGTTAGLAVPLHRRLGAGWDIDAHTALVRADGVRVAAASANVVLVAALALLA